jgi:hypothetical protein
VPWLWWWWRCLLVHEEEEEVAEEENTTPWNGRAVDEDAKAATWCAMKSALPTT